jgi:hypothetical protein
MRLELVTWILMPLLKGWLTQYLEYNNPSEIHFLFEKNGPGLPAVLDTMHKKELDLYNTKFTNTRACFMKSKS